MVGYEDWKRNEPEEYERWLDRQEVILEVYGPLAKLKEEDWYWLLTPWGPCLDKREVKSYQCPLGCLFDYRRRQYCIRCEIMGKMRYNERLNSLFHIAKEAERKLNIIKDLCSGEGQLPRGPNILTGEIYKTSAKRYYENFLRRG